jgi:hypothetical protein
MNMLRMISKGIIYICALIGGARLATELFPVDSNMSTATMFVVVLNLIYDFIVKE